jgi:GAF domain-containing protein
MPPLRARPSSPPRRPAGKREERAPAAEQAFIRLAEAVAAGLTRREVLDLVVRAAAGLPGEATVHLWLVDESGARLTLEAEHGAKPGTQGVPLPRTLTIHEGLVGAVAATREPVVIATLAGERRVSARAWLKDQGLVSFAGVPLMRADRLLGVLCLFTSRRHRFSRREVSLLRSFGAHAAVAIENAALFDAATGRLRRLEALREIDRELAGERDPDTLLALIGRRATELLGGDSATVYVLEEATQLLRARASYNIGEWIRDAPIPVGQGVAGTAAARRRGMVVNDYSRSPLAIPPYQTHDWAVVAHPLLHGDTLQGVLLVRRAAAAGGFSDADLIQLGDFAVQASIALENARLLRLASARAERIKVAAEIGQALAATRDADRILDLIAERCRDVLGAEALGLFRFDSSGRLRFVRGSGLPEEFMREHTLAVGEGVVGRAAAERRAVETADVLGDPAISLSPEARARVRGIRSRAIAAAPLLAGGEVLGVLAVYHPVGFLIPREEAEFLESLAAHAAAALESVRLFAETRGRQESAETLAAVTQTLTGSLDLRTLLARVADAIHRLVACDGSAIGLVGPDGAVHLSARKGVGAEAFRAVRVRPGEGATGWVLQHGEPFFTADYANDPRISSEFLPEVREAGIRGMLSVPVRLREETVGVLHAFYARPVRITAEDVARVTDLARVVAVAVANARLYEEARQREGEARALFEVGRLISATLDPDAVLDRIVETILELMDVRACGIFRTGPDGRLRYARGAGLSGSFVSALVVGPGEGTSGRAVADRAPMWTADILSDPGLALNPEARRLIEREGYRAVLSVPILGKEAPLGCLATYWWGPYVPTPAQIGTLDALATLTAVALENARLYDETRRHMERLERLNQVNRAVSASLRIGDVLNEMTRAAWSFFDATHVTIWLVDEARRSLTRPAGHGDPALLAQMPTALAYGEGGAGWVAEHRTPIIDVPLDDPRILGGAISAGFGVDSFSAFPILSGERLLGVLTIGRGGGSSRPPLSASDLTLVRTLLGQAAVAVENARLFEEAQTHEAEATRAYQDLKAAQEQLVRTEKLRALGEMASGVAHDFNNLLAAILGRVQLLARKVEDPTLQEWLRIIEQAALDGAQTVRQIQEFTRVRRDQPSQTVDVNAVVRDAVEITRTRWRDETQSRGVDVRVVVELGDVPPVDGHPAELREALTNLILNAVDALPRGGVITMRTATAHEGAVVTVADTGTGMSESVKRRIFEPFFSTKGPKGTGLGLAMVYGIVSRHGGEIAVESKEGEGSTFTIHLPPGRLRASRLPPPTAVPADGVGRVLVIDDEPQVRSILAEILRVQKHEVVEAERGADGLARFREQPFDLVMTDLAMPGMSGWQVAQAIKAERPGVPVVLVTGWGVELPPDQLRRSGVDRVMTKPFRFEDVREVVASFQSPI